MRVSSTIICIKMSFLTMWVEDHDMVGGDEQASLLCDFGRAMVSGRWDDCNDCC